MNWYISGVFYCRASQVIPLFMSITLLVLIFLRTINVQHDVFLIIFYIDTINVFYNIFFERFKPQCEVLSFLKTTNDLRTNLQFI